MNFSPKKKKFHPLRTPPKKFRFQVIDTEDDSKGTLKQIGMLGDLGEAVFTERIPALAFLLESAKNEENIYFVCHNLEYDIVNLFWGTQLFREATMRFSGQGLVSVDVRGLKFIDSYRHCPYGVERLGREVVGIKKLAFDPDSPEYVLNDCRIPYEYMRKAQDEYNALGAQIRATAPATAMDLFRRKYMSEPLPVFDMETVDWFRSGYYGGRTECFYIGTLEGEIYDYDVNSMYPHAMMGEFPDLWSLRPNDHPAFNDHGMAEAEIHLDHLDFPLLPVRYNGKLVFPTGKWRGVYTLLELREARNAGYDIKLLKGWTTTNAVYPFTEYVTDLYGLRQDAKKRGDKIKDTVYKLLMNSLYGKFGAGKENFSLVDPSDLPPSVTVVNSYGGKAVIISEDEYPPYANAVWAAHVTARSRIILWKYMLEASEYGEVLYCDTDSIIMRAAGKPSFRDSLELGGLKLVGQEKSIMIVLPKVYRFGNEYKAKGARNPKDFINLGMSKDVQPIRLREGLKRGLRPNVWVEKVKMLKGSYDKRVVLKSGFTRPLKMS